jgi:hypothetical protein
MPAHRVLRAAKSTPVVSRVLIARTNPGRDLPLCTSRFRRVLTWFGSIVSDQNSQINFVKTGDDYPFCPCPPTRRFSTLFAVGACA